LNIVRAAQTKLIAVPYEVKEVSAWWDKLGKQMFILLNNSLWSLVASQSLFQDILERDSGVLVQVFQ
jgi:hypothetical protein